jgi:hypothetical protein
MARITPGSLAGQLSGSIGNTTFSRNRYGAYARVRAIPVQPDTQYQVTQRGILSNASRKWNDLTAEQRLAWEAWAQTNPIVDRLGVSQILQANAAYVQLTCNCLQIAAVPPAVPPVIPPPLPLTSLSLTADIGAGDVAITYAATPVPANVRLLVRGCVLAGGNINFIKNRLRTITSLDPAAASPQSIQIPLEARFGTLVVGHKVYVYCAMLSQVNGQLSVPLRAVATVVST